MLHVALDTSTYRANPRRNSPPFRALYRLAKAQKVRIYLPHLVKREFLSQQYEQIAAALKGLRDHAEGLRRLTSDDDLADFAQSILHDAEKQVKTAKGAADDEFAKWLVDVGAEELPITLMQTQNVIDDYFNGNPPYKKVKNREDMPDSLIWNSILGLARKYGDIHFVTGDNSLRSAAVPHTNISAYKKLEEFIQSKACQDALEELASETSSANMKRVAALLPELSEALAEEIGSAITNALAGRDVHDRQIPDDNQEGMITGVGEPTEIEPDFESIDLYGEDEIGIQFDVLVECTLNYAIYKADYYLLDESKTERISIDERNDHYYDADEDYTLRVTGLLTLKLDGKRLAEDGLTDEDLEGLISNADYGVDLQDVTVEDTTGSE